MAKTLMGQHAGTWVRRDTIDSEAFLFYEFCGEAPELHSMMHAHEIVGLYGEKAFEALDRAVPADGMEIQVDRTLKVTEAADAEGQKKLEFAIPE